jgi:cell division transport system ATP-binding protein
VIELAEGKIVRDEQAGAYAASESTREFAIRMRGAQQ